MQRGDIRTYFVIFYWVSTYYLYIYICISIYIYISISLSLYIYLCYLYGPGSNSTLTPMSTTRSQIFSYKFQIVQDDPGIAHCSKK